MFKVLEIHSAYISSALTVVVHLLIGFYLLYILKISYVEYMPSGKEKRVVWYQAPSKVPQQEPRQAVYQEPTPQNKTEPVESPITQPSTRVAIPVAPPAAPTDISPLRKGRSAQERRAAWTKKQTASAQEQKETPLTAATFVDAVSQEQAIKRHAHAVYTKQQAIKNSVAAQIREITDGRLRNKIFSALKIACALNKKEYYSPVPVDATIMTSLVMNQKGEIIAVEVLKSTGTPLLDEHIAQLLQSIKKIALPPSRTGQDLYTQTFTCRVTCPAGSGHFEFSYDEGSGVHIM